MADLPIQADRMNDIEIAANSPITESLMRRFGSNINYLLDFLGITDGSTAVAGTLNDLATAVELVSTHTMDLQASIPTGVGSPAYYNIGSYTTTKFVNQVFYYVLTNNTGFVGPNDVYDFTGGAGSTPSLELDIDSAGYGYIPLQKRTGNLWEYTSNSEHVTGASTTTNRFSSLISGPQTMTLGHFGFTPNLQAMMPVASLDWRDGTTQDLRVYHQNTIGNISAYQFYRQYVLDIKSIGF